MVAADHAGLLEPAHAAQARRGRDAGATRKLDIGHPAVSLKLRQDAAVDRVQDGHVGMVGLFIRALYQALGVWLGW